jgi:hypothetical protein
MTNDVCTLIGDKADEDQEEATSNFTFLSLQLEEVD